MAQKVFGITIGKEKPEDFTQPQISEQEKEAYRYTPQLPNVNLIPSQFTEKYQIRHLVRNFVAGAVLIALLLGGGWAGTQYYMNNQGNKIEQLTAEQQQLTTEAAQLQPYRAYETNVNTKRDLFSEITRTDINMGELYGFLNRSATRNQVDVTGLQVTQYLEADSATECINPDPYVTFESAYVVAGCIKMEGEADSLASTLNFLDQLVQQGDVEGDVFRHQFVSSYRSTEEANLNEGDRENQFSATVFFTDALFSNKYVDFFISGGAQITGDEEEKTLMERLTTLLGGETTTEEAAALERMSGEACNAAFNLDLDTELLSLVMTHTPAVGNPEQVKEQMLTLMTEACDGGN